MLKRILDTSGIDMNDPEIKWELETDLRRMNRLPHKNMPKNVDTYKVKVTPSTQTYMQGLHRFIFEIRYGMIKKGKFQPKGKHVLYQSETLPMI